MKMTRKNPLALTRRPVSKSDNAEHHANRYVIDLITEQ